jgi:hypothetical protein
MNYDFIEDSVKVLNEAGFGSIFLAEYEVFAEIIDGVNDGSIPYNQGIALVLQAAREIYYEEEYDPGDEGIHMLLDRLVEAAPGRFAV